LTDVSEELTTSIIWAMNDSPCLITLLIEAVRFSEMLVNIYQTVRSDIPEDSHLHTRRCENLKSHQL
jgi:hypothetical protein